MDVIAKYQICKRCVMDTTDPQIVFDEDGVCNHCKQAEKKLKSEPFCLPLEEKGKKLSSLVKEIKASAKNNPYDCIIGLSGGVDSSYVAYRAKELGLRPLAVHLDNGWNSEFAVQNIESICKKLEIDLYTWVLDWEEFKDLQLSFLKASTPDSEIPSDNAIFGAIWRLAVKYKVKYILAGYNQISESILPTSWSQGYFDSKYISAVQQAFGEKKLDTFPLISKFDIIFNQWVRKIRLISFLDYMTYNKEQAKEIIADKLSWRDYGRKHCESHYTRIYQEYILPTKFGFDKRRAHFSSLIIAGQMSRQDALLELEKPLYPSREILDEDIMYLINKFGISKKEWDNIMNSTVKSYYDYPNYENTWYIQIASKLYHMVKGTIK